MSNTINIILLQCKWYLDGLSERAVVVDGVAVGLDGDLLLYARLHHAVALRLVLQPYDDATVPRVVEPDMQPLASRLVTTQDKKTWHACTRRPKKPCNDSTIPSDRHLDGDRTKRPGARVQGTRPQKNGIRARTRNYASMYG
ncbi:jg17186 [Pararge aegeria aegeria]|uniref:Jg17186 protein n=1 Tax=Pararge aegeria aegeria TaxID=348720 RepID=A0A8S4SBD2_9NEOP|nr:jg17186 [Pararge aegeria aegeria]